MVYLVLTLSEYAFCPYADGLNTSSFFVVIARDKDVLVAVDPFGTLTDVVFLVSEKTLVFFDFATTAEVTSWR